MGIYSGTAVFFYGLFLVLFARLGAGGSQDECNVSRCSNHGPLIHFPFWLKDSQQPPDRCGYPGFELSCNERKQTVLGLPFAVKVLIENIDYKSHEIQVYDRDACLPTQLPRLNLSASPFQFSESANNIDLALYNCSAPKPNLWKLVPCLSVNGYHVYAVVSDLNVASLPLTSCTKIRNVASVPPDAFDQKSIRLTWLKPDCSKCEAADKICSWKNNSMESESETECFDKPKITKGIRLLLPLLSCFYL